jgi:hypothetical protein
MRGFFEGVHVIALFILTRLIIVRVVIALAQVTASFGGPEEPPVRA